MATNSAVAGRFRRGSTLIATFKGNLKIGGTLGEDTSSETSGHEHRAIVKKGEQFTGEFFIPADSSVEELNLDFGDEGDCDIRMGEGKAWLDWAFIVESVDVTAIDKDGFVVANVTMHAQEAKPEPTAWA